MSQEMERWKALRKVKVRDNELSFETVALN